MAQFNPSQQPAATTNHQGTAMTLILLACIVTGSALSVPVIRTLRTF